jgi:von Willebrand factor type A domain
MRPPATRAVRRSQTSPSKSLSFPVPTPAPSSPVRSSSARRPQSTLAEVHALRNTIEELHGERLRLLKQRRLHLSLLGLAVSLPIHILILIWLASIYLPGPASQGPPTMTFELGVLNDEQLTDGMQTEDLSVAELETAQAASASELEASSPAIGIDMSANGALDAQGGGQSGLGATGSGGLGPGGGGGGGASFFGIGGRGSRFVYIVDISGSMANGSRYQVAMDELKRSITALPDFASFAVYLFADRTFEPPFQETYLKALPSNIVRMKKWLDTTGPMGGTDPGQSFEKSLALSPLPDVIFFLTDGEIPDHTPDYLSSRNGANGKKRVVIHTVAFSNDAGQAILRRIARDSEGTFRYVPVGGN